jgi:hypothetical protein
MVLESPHDLMTRTTTPQRVSQLVRKFCRRVVPDGEPLYLHCGTVDAAIPQECFQNVAARVAADGGSVQHGWTIWMWPSVLLEAEFHAVWRAPEGDLVDVSPRIAKEDRILFLPDPSRVYAGRQVDNIRQPLSKDDVVKDFIALAEARFWVLNRGDRADAHEVAIEDPRERAVLMLGAMTGHMLFQRMKSNDPCACGSGFKYRTCCGPRVRELLADLRP